MAEEFIIFTALYAAAWFCYLEAVGFKVPESDLGVLLLSLIHI